MTDLIWVGNTLLPRWLIIVAVFAIMVGIAGLVSYLENRS